MVDFTKKKIFQSSNMNYKQIDKERPELAVKLDYSITYRENDKLNDNLDERLTGLSRTQYRKLTEKEEQLELAKVDADQILKLKEAVNSHQGNVDILHFLAQDDNADDDADDSDTSRHRSLLSRAERRLAKEKELFSARKLFNVIRSSDRNAPQCSDVGSLDGANKNDNFHDVRRAMSAMTLSTNTVKKPSAGRPQTSPGLYKHNVSRLASANSSYQYDRYNRSPRPRSRRELQRLCELKNDPFKDCSKNVENYSLEEGHIHRLLETSREHNEQIQARVTAFVKEIEEFNKKSKTKTRLELIFESKASQ